MALIKIKQVDGLQTEVDKIVELSLISSRDSLIDLAAQDYASDAQSAAEATASADATAKANAAESNAVATADTAAGSRDTLVLSDADTAAGSRDTLVLSDADTAAGSRDTLVLSAADTAAGSRDALIVASAGNLEVRVGDLEDKLIEDDEFFVESLPGSDIGPYTLSRIVHEDEVELVWAYVNGVSVEVEEVNGQDVTLRNPGYDIDADDTVKFHFQG